MKRIKKAFAIIITACLVLTNAVPAFAEVDMQSEQEQAVEGQVNAVEIDYATPSELSVLDEENTAKKQITEALTAEKETKSEAFIREDVVGGIKVSLTADAGVFPDDAVLSVEAVQDADTEEVIEGAVESIRKKGANVASSYKFDIKVLLDGEEIQPDTDKGEVKVSFTFAEKVNDSLDISIYHVSDDEGEILTAENLDAKVKTVDAAEADEDTEDEVLPDGVIENDSELAAGGGGAWSIEANNGSEVTEVTAFTDGFSYYVVEFTYSALQYVLNGDCSIKLSEILYALNLEGTVTDAEVSDESLFVLEKDEDCDDWTVTALQAFESDEWLKVIIGGQVYEITVTDALSNWSRLDDAINDCASSISGLFDVNNDASGNIKIKLLTDFTAADGDTFIETAYSEGIVTLDLNGHTIDRNLSLAQSNGYAFKVGMGSEFTIIDSSSGQSGKITGGNNTGSGGGIVVAGGKFTLSGGSVTGNEAVCGGGIYVGSGSFTMRGGSIISNEAENGGGLYIAGGYAGIAYDSVIDKNKATEKGGGIYIDSGKSLTMYSGMIGGETMMDGNSASICGGGIYNAGTLNMSGVSIMNNLAMNGGGIFNTGTVTMSGTKIGSNFALGCGAGIYAAGEVLASTCTFSECEADMGGAVYVSTQGRFEMGGGTIEKCNASIIGGGVCVENGDGLTGVATFGSSSTYDSNPAYVKNCTAGEQGGGIYSDGVIGLSHAVIENCSAGTGCGICISNNGRAFVGGKTIVSDNAENGGKSNLYLEEGGIVTIGSGPDVPSPAGGMSIGIAMENPGVFTTNEGTDYIGYFSSDDENYSAAIDVDSGRLKLERNSTLTCLVTFDTDGGSAVASQEIEMGGTVTEPEAPTKTDYRFVCWLDDIGGAEYDFAQPVENDFTLYAKWEGITEPAITLETGKSVYTEGEEVTVSAKTTGIADGTYAIRETVDGIPIPDAQISINNGAASWVEKGLGKGQHTIEVEVEGVTASVTFEIKEKSDPYPHRSSASNTTALFTGTWNNPVSDGTWTQDANGVWHYNTNGQFRATWGYIVNPYAAEGQNKADWFWFDEKGNMLTGWQYINGKWYYLNPNMNGTGTLGACLIGPGKTPDGYEVDTDGAWTGR